MRVAITGAGGFIATPLIEQLAAHGHEVVVFLRSNRTGPWLRTRCADVVEGDVRDPDAVARAVRGAEVVYHMARARGHAASTRAEVDSTNVDGTQTVANVSARLGVRVLVNCSSAAVYGSARPGPPLSEDAELRPDSPYARSKVAAEVVARQAAGDRMVLVTARICPVLGPGCRSWLSLVRSVRARRLPVIGAGLNWHHTADVSDIVEGLVRCGGPHLASSTYNLAGPEPVTLHTMLSVIAAAVGAEPPFRIPAAPVRWFLSMNDVIERRVGIELPSATGARFLATDRRLDLARAAADLGFRPSVAFRDAVDRTVQWYRSEGLLGAAPG